MSNTCIECKVRPARHWGSSFCEDCFRKLLKEKLEGEEPNNEKSESHSNKD